MNAHAKDGRGETSSWSAAGGARRVGIPTPGLTLGLVLVVAAVTWYSRSPTSTRSDLPEHVRARIETRGRIVSGLACTPDGSRLVSVASLTGAIATRDATSGRLLVPFQTGLRLAPTPAFALAPDGQTVAVGFSREGISIGDVDTGKLTLRVPDPTVDVGALAFTPDGGTILAAREDQTIRAYDTSTWQEMRSWSVAGAAIRRLAVAPDGRTLAGGGTDGRLRCWDIDSGRLLATLPATSVPVSFVYAPDGATLATGGLGGQIRLWDTATLRERLHLDREDFGYIYCLAFSPDSRLLATGHGDHVVRLWDPATGQLLHSLRGHGHSVLSLAFAPDGLTLASGASDATILLWTLEGLLVPADQAQTKVVH
jgi:WD40 repeat protein